MRSFVAINLPAAERDRLQRAAGLLRTARLPVRWVQSDALHLTLKFLGEVPEARAGDIERALDRVAGAFAPFDLELRGVGGFPNLSNPRVVWVGVQAPPDLARLAADAEDAMAELGFPREGRPFTAHLTLGRAERDARASAFRDMVRMAAEFDFVGQVRVESVDLMRSHLSPRGARYERLHAAPLTGTSSNGSG